MMRQLASLENRVRQLEEGFNNEITVEDLIRCELAEMIGTINTEVTEMSSADAKHLGKSLLCQFFSHSYMPDP